MDLGIANGAAPAARSAGRCLPCIRLLAGMLCGLAAQSAAISADTTLERMLDCMRANVPRTVQVRDIMLEAMDAQGSKRRLSGRLYAVREEGRLNAMIRLDAPADLAGAAYLSRERPAGDELYLYMPALQKVRRLTGASADEALWGTDFSVGDLRQIGAAFSAGTVTAGPSATLDGRDVQRLTVRPDPGTRTRFDLIELWVDRESCVTLRADFQRAGKLRKQLTASPAVLQRSGTHWYAEELLVRDLELGSQTRLNVTGVRSDASIPGHVFNPRTFYIGG